MLIKYSYTPDFDEYFSALKEGVLHGHELANLDGVGEQTDIAEFSRKFFGTVGDNGTTADVSIDANANVDDTSVIAYESEIGKPIGKLNAYYLLYKYAKELYGKEQAEELIFGQFVKNYYINDFFAFNKPYCFNFSCTDVMFGGLPFVKKIKSRPPKHLSSFMGQMVQFVTYASNSVAGAVGLADLIICASYYVERMMIQNKTVPRAFLWEQVKQEFQSFIYSVNQPFRGGNQSAFTNVSVYDDFFLDSLCESYYFPDGSQPNKNMVKKLQEMFLDLMNDTLAETPCTFPVTTACFAVSDKRKIKDKAFLKMIMEKNIKYGFINLYAGKTSTLSSCCRLRSEQDTEYFNAFGSGSSKIGSLGVVSMNLPRLAIRSKGNIDYFLYLVRHNTGLVAKINNTKRTLIKERIANGNLPLYTLGFMDLGKQYSTCGLVGINEAVKFLGHDVLNKQGQDIVKQILNAVNEENARYQKEFDTPHNCEQTPSENSAIKLAQADIMLGFQSDYELYSNQFIPLITEAQMMDRIRLQGMFDQYMTGGAICHINIADEPTEQHIPFMIKTFQKAVELGVIYCAYNYNTQRCSNGHITVGKRSNCPVCQATIVDNFTRVVGFLVRVDNWHKVRREQDYPNRQFYIIGG